MRVALGPPVFEHPPIIDIVEDQEPRLGEAAIGEKLERVARRLRAILGARQPAKEMIAQIDQPLLDFAPTLGIGVARRVEPPDAGIVILVPPGIFACQGRFADAAKAGHRRRLGDGDRRILARPQRIVNRLQLLIATGEARCRLDRVMQQRAGAAPMGAERPVMPALGIGPDRVLDDRGEEIVALAHRHQVPIGDGAQQPARLALRRAQNDEPGLAVQGIAVERVHPFGGAVVGGEIFGAHDGDDARPRAQRRIHALHEIAVLEVPLLEDHPMAFRFDDRAHLGRHRHVGRMRARPADEEIGQWLRGFVHKASRGGVGDARIP
jgi:hypothetical protein